MPVSPALAEHLAADMVDAYAEAERQMLARMAKRLAKGIDGPAWAEAKLFQIQAYKRECELLLSDLEAKARTGVETAITKAYEQGGLAAVDDIARLKLTKAAKYAAIEWEPMPNWPWVLREPDGRVLHKFKTIEQAQSFVDKHPIYIRSVPSVEPLAGLRAVEALTAETLANLTATHRGAVTYVTNGMRTVIDEATRATIERAGAQVLLGTQTRRQAAQSALDRFARAGVRGFIDKAGRGWTLESYTEMAMRTGCGRAAVQGHVDRLQANGLDLVIVSDAPKECPLCRPWEGKVLSIGGVPVEMPEGTDPAFQVDSGVVAEVPGAETVTVPLDPYTPAASSADVAAALKERYGIEANLRGLSTEDANALGKAVHDEAGRSGPLTVRGVRSGTPGNGAIADWDPSSRQMHYSGGRMDALGQPLIPTAAGEVSRLEALASEWADAAASSPRNARVLRQIEADLAKARATFAAGRTPLPFNAFHYAADRQQLVEWLWTHELAHVRMSQRGDLADRVAGWFNFGKPKYPSDYARHDFGEWWAESFSLWRGGRGDLIDPRLHDLFEKEFTK